MLVEVPGDYYEVSRRKREEKAAREGLSPSPLTEEAEEERREMAEEAERRWRR